MTEITPPKHVTFTAPIKPDAWLNPFGDYDHIVLDATQDMNGIRKIWKLTSSVGAPQRLLSSPEVTSALENMFIATAVRKDYP
jgi:hypothetical protein